MGPVSECEIFGAICETLESLGQHDISQMMRIPFDIMTQDDLLTPFKGIGFSNFQISKQEEKMHIDGEKINAITFAYSSPIGPKLNAMSNEKQEEFQRIFMDKVNQLNQNCLLYTSPSPRDQRGSRMPSSA